MMITPLSTQFIQTPAQGLSPLRGMAPASGVSPSPQDTLILNAPRQRLEPLPFVSPPKPLLTGLGRISQIPQTPAQGTITLDILSLNTFALPRPIGKDIAERTARIGRTIGKYDIIGFQETFSKEANAIKSQSQQLGDGFQIYQPPNRFITNSGLSNFSKYQIVEQGFKPFKYSSHADAFAKKGVAFTRILIPGSGLVDVYNTHFQAAGDKEHGPVMQLLMKLTGKILPGFDMPRNEIRMHDAQVLVDFVREKDQGYPLFVLGDFNTKDSTPIYQFLTQSLQLKDSFRQANPDDPGYTSDGARNPLKNNPNSRSRIDFLFYRAGKNIDVNVLSSQLAYDSAIDGKFVSDHFGVHTRFELRSLPL